MVLVIDNYDSFTYNLVQYLGEIGCEIKVKRNNAVTVDEVDRMMPSQIVISPGPGRPEQAGISVALIRSCAGRIPILGVCLGHQAIGTAFGGTIVAAPSLVHGKTSTIEHDGLGVFTGIPQRFMAGRYHSLVLSSDLVPGELEVAATAVEDGSIMAVRHRQWPVHGVQFHPESVLTDEGRQILTNFIER